VKYSADHYLYGMLCIRSLNNDPFYNLAAEEYLMRNYGEDVFMLWQSNPVVVVGKHQNTLAEINYRFTRENNIPVARRLTGGGTVYHDRGNINFTFIRKGEPGRMVDFGSFIAPVTEFLIKYGIDAIRGPKNEILVNGRKISGNAEHVYKNRVLHHGTLLYNADLNLLRKSIKPGTGRYVDRAVQSNRSSVMNITDCLNPAPETGDFGTSFFQDVMMRFQGELYTPREDEKSVIQTLSRQKYRTWDWVYGWSPDYTFHGDFQTAEIVISIELSAHRGIISQCQMRSETFPQNLLESFAGCLRDTPHEENNIRDKLTTCGFRERLSEKDFSNLVFSFFS
jgi:lipoate---protein ligase